MVSGSAYMHMFSSAQPVYLLLGAFNPFTFKVIIDMYDPITIVLIVLGLSGRSRGEGNGNPLQHSCLENPMDGEAW